jgi:hypothetical protein
MLRRQKWGSGNHLKTLGSEGRETLPAVAVPALHFEDSGDYLREIAISHVLLKGMSRDIFHPPPEAAICSRAIQPHSTLAELFVSIRFSSA